jgi:hypothetical protein
MAGYIGSTRPYVDGSQEADLCLVAIFPYTSGSGTGTCYHFKDAAGHVLVSFSERRATLAIGDRVRASFVVQSHEEYNGVQQNITKKFKILKRL